MIALAGLAELVARTSAVVVRGDTLVVAGGEPIAIDLADQRVSVEFGGWVEAFAWPPDDDEARDEAHELALDFVAAALFGELRIVELQRGGQVLRRALEICVDGTWRGYGRRGELGLAGSLAQLLGRTERRIRGNVGRVARPRSLADAGPSGHPRAPWSGAAGRASNEPAEIVIDGELDLHNFTPKEVAPLIREYIEVCQQRGVRDLRIVHGKGTGALRRTVHAVLAKHEAVESYRLGGHREGSWGATIVRLR